MTHPDPLDEPWMADAGCLDSPVEFWFPDMPDAPDGFPYIDDGTIDSYIEGGTTEPYYEKGKEICENDCPVRDHCLAYALANKERYGMWGGLRPIERLRIERKRRRTRMMKRRAKEAE